MLYREIQKATNLIRSALAQGWTVSVLDGIDGDGGRVVHRSTDFNQIFDSLDTTEGDLLRFRKPTGESTGWVLLIWGNDDDLISDYSDNLEVDDDGNVRLKAVAA